MNYLDRDPRRCAGAPTIQNRRLTVLDVVSGIQGAGGYTQYARVFDVPLTAIRNALAYCSRQLCRDGKTSQNSYCDGCRLRSQADGLPYSDDAEEITLATGSIMTTYEGGVFFGPKQAFIQEALGVAGWKMAKEVLVAYPELLN